MLFYIVITFVYVVWITLREFKKATTNLSYNLKRATKFEETLRGIYFYPKILPVHGYITIYFKTVRPPKF